MAYAAVVLLMRDLEELLHSQAHPIPIGLKKEHIESLHKEVSLLQVSLKDSQEKMYDHDVKSLEKRIGDAAYRAADFIDSHVYISYIRNADIPERKIEYSRISLIAHQNFSQIIKEIELIKLEALKLFDKQICDTEVLPHGNSSVQDSSPSSLNAEDRLVGIDNDIKALLHRLTGFPSHRKVIPITGMGGIGKTTLAGRIYNDPIIIHHFYVRAWITVSQGYNLSLSYRMREMLLGILRCFTNITDEICKKTNEELGEKLYKTLKGMRYLIVLDDLWDVKAWDFLKQFLPDDVIGSRILLTSRHTEVAVYISSKSSAHRMHFLRDAESWELLESKLFAKESCPPELVEMGKRIAERCQGLPLAIVVVAGLLSNVSRTLDCWKRIAETVLSLVAEKPQHCTDILALSYNYLPNPLKPCFLYMGAFPLDYEIPVSRLIWLWIAEGFIQPVGGKRLEEVAEDYLEDLVGRNLILVGKRRSNGRIKTCHIHDLLRDVCLRESMNQNFLQVIKRYAPIPQMESIYPRRISLHASILHYYYSMGSQPLTRSFLCFDVNKILPDIFLLEFLVQVDFKLLVVLDIMLLRSNHFPIEVVDLVHLRYLALSTNSELPGSISKLQNLQTLIIDHIWEGQYLPREIWSMSQLRHIHLKRGCYFPLPYSWGIESSLTNLQTLSTLIGPVSCSKEVYARMPRLRKLEIYATETDFGTEWISECLRNLVCLNDLETLKCNFLYRPRMHRLPEQNVFPSNLKKFTLSGSYLPWEDMKILGMLPNLEVLKLRSFAFDGDKWSPVEGGFLRLKLLVIENSDPDNWDADESHFPRLQRLVLKECTRLREIPEGIGEIRTMQLIEIHDCSFSVVMSARKIQEQQEVMGNDELSVQISWGGYHSQSDLPIDYRHSHGW